MLVWNKALDGGFRATTPKEAEYVEIYNMINICKEFGWTEKQYLETSVSFIEDCISLLSLKNIRENPDNKKKLSNNL